MSGKVPRRPKGESGAASSAAAQRLSQAHVDPSRDALMSAFLRGAAPTVASDQDADVIAVALRSMLKKNETTKLKALADIAAAFDPSSSVADGAIAEHIASFADAFRQCVQHESAAVRRQVCTCTKLLLGRGKEMKMKLAPEIATMLGPWLCTMHDTYPEVAREARAALDAAFATEKQPDVVKKFKTQALRFIDELIGPALATPLSSDPSDVRTNYVVSGVGALGFCFQHCPDARADVQALPCMGTLGALVPKPGARGGSVAGKAPAVRTSLLLMFAAMVQAGADDLTPALHKAIATAATAFISDKDADVAAAAWRTTLLWIRHAPAQAATHKPKAWKDTVLSAVAECTEQHLVVALTSLYPLCVVGRRAGMLATADVREALQSITTRLDEADAAPTATALTVAAIECWSLVAGEGGVPQYTDMHGFWSQLLAGAHAQVSRDADTDTIAQAAKTALAKIIAAAPEAEAVVIRAVRDAVVPIAVGSLAVALTVAVVEVAMTEAPDPMQPCGANEAYQLLHAVAGAHSTKRAWPAVLRLVRAVPIVAFGAPHIAAAAATTFCDVATYAASSGDARVLEGVLDAVVANDRLEPLLDQVEWAPAVVDAAAAGCRARNIAVPAALTEASSNRLCDAMTQRNWRTAKRLVDAMAQHDAETASTVIVKVHEALAPGKTTVAEVQQMLDLVACAVPESMRNGDAALLDLLEDIRDTLHAALPQWQPSHFAIDALASVNECEESDEEDADDESDNAADDDTEADAAAAADDASAATATNMRALIAELNTALHAWDALCTDAGNAQAASGLAQCVDLALECTDPKATRPSVLAALSCLTLPEGFTPPSLSLPSTLLELATEALSDATLPTSVAHFTGVLPRRTVVQDVFAEPVAALGLGLCVVADCLAADVITMRAKDAEGWLRSTIDAFTLWEALTEKPQRALLHIAEAALATGIDAATLVTGLDDARSVAFAALCESTDAHDATVRFIEAAAEAWALGSASRYEHGVAVRRMLDLVARLEFHRLALSPAALAALRARFDDKTTSLDAACTTMHLLRRAGVATALTPPTVTHIVKLKDQATRMSFAGVELIAEAASWPCPDRGMSQEFALQAERAVTQAYALHHLPTNGKLGQRIPRSAPIPTPVFRDVAHALGALRRGVAKNHTASDSLRNTTTLALLDVACECVLRLRNVKTEEAALLVETLVDIAEVAEKIQRSEVRTLRASPLSVEVVANLVASVHFWLCSRATRVFEECGESAVLRIVALVNRLAVVVLVDCNAPEALQPLMAVITRAPVRSLGARNHGEGTESVRPRDAKRHLAVCTATAKARASLLTYFACWYAALSNEAAIATALSNKAAPAQGSSSSDAAATEVTTNPVESKASMIHLLDVVVALAHARPHGLGGVRTFLSEAGRGETLGFDVQLLGTPPDDETGVRQHMAMCGFTVLSLALQRRAVRHVRLWGGTLVTPLYQSFEAFVRANISPMLIQNSLAEVLAHSPTGEAKFQPEQFSDVTVAVNTSESTVLLKYATDEMSCDLGFVLPPAYPLRPAQLSEDSMKMRTRAGVPAEKWRGWMLKITTMMISGGAGVWTCIGLFVENIQKQLDGVEPCPICYSVVSAVTHKLPELACAVCKNSRFHSQCLYEWWGNSGQTSCPLCRSPWFAA